MSLRAVWHVIFKPGTSGTLLWIEGGIPVRVGCEACGGAGSEVLLHGGPCIEVNRRWNDSGVWGRMRKSKER
jgi:hypothetical protein